MSLLNSRMVIIAVASAAMCGLLLIETTTHTAKLVYRVVVADQLFRRPQKFVLQRMVGGAYHYNRLFSSLVRHLLLEFPGRRKSNKQSYDR
jgi:hypothetical protein